MRCSVSSRSRSSWWKTRQVFTDSVSFARFVLARSNSDGSISDQYVSIYIIGEEDTYGFMGKLKPIAIKCIFLGYPKGVKGYRLWMLDDVKPKIIIRRDVVFNESLMYKDTLKGAGATDSKKEVEFEVELQSTKRTTAIPARYRDKSNVSLSRPSGSRVKDDMVAYAFAITEEEDTHEQSHSR
ncbi:hypothetical protein Tco_1526114, partial [Tanacetum coccineum]